MSEKTAIESVQDWSHYFSIKEILKNEDGDSVPCMVAQLTDLADEAQKIAQRLREEFPEEFLPKPGIAYYNCANWYVRDVQEAMCRPPAKSFHSEWPIENENLLDDFRVEGNEIKVMFYLHDDYAVIVSVHCEATN